MVQLGLSKTVGGAVLIMNKSLISYVDGFPKQVETLRCKTEKGAKTGGSSSMSLNL